jgi:hypothetical protein
MKMPIAHVDLADARHAAFLDFSSSLRQELHELNARLRQLVPARRRPGDEDPLQPFRGLVVSDEEVTGLLEELDRALARSEQLPRRIRYTDPGEVFRGEESDREDGSLLTRLCQTFRLSLLERRCLVAALAPELDSRYERIFAFLQDDVTRRAPSVGLLLDLIGPNDLWTARRLFLSSSPLILWQFLHLSDRPTGEHCSLLAKAVHLDARIVEHLLDGESVVSPNTLQEITGPPPYNAERWQAARTIFGEWRAGAADRSCVFVLAGPDGVGQRDLAEWLACDESLPLFWIDARGALKAEGSPRLMVREALLREAALAVDHAEIGLTDESVGAGLAALAGLVGAQTPLIILVCNGPWTASPALGEINACVVDLPLPTRAERIGLWSEALSGLTKADDETLLLLASRFPLAPRQIQAVAGELRHATHLGEEATTAERLQRLCRAQLPSRLAGVIEIEPERTWSDLILPGDVRGQLEELCSQARNRSTVLGSWGFDAHLSGGKGLHALFTGPPGTGKTLAAEVIAGVLGRMLWRIDLAQLISKYIGETEKNVDRVFRAAAGANVLLFFDEADALFGRRSEVKDAHDRYANQEVSYLLQQMEEYDGVAVLATNLARNLDEAFQRRLQFAVCFPFPDEDQRRRIWEVVFPAKAPLDATVDLTALARAVRLSGGHIRNIALSAAYLAADRGQPIGMTHLWHAARREYQKVGQSWTPPGTEGKS